MASAESTRTRILLVEDEPAIADTTTYALTTDGFEPTWCTTGQAALAALGRTTFGLVIVDVGLPDINGFDLFREIQARWRVPVIFLTARTSEIDRVVGLELGADDYVPKPFSPRELCARVRTVLRRVVRQFEELVVDQTRFKQILINLVSNALKFRHPRGVVRVASARGGNDIRFEVCDRGVGITPEDIPNLFRPFRQARNGKELNTGGVGLGLAITRKLVELHGGSVWIESEPGKGTSVFFTIPLIVNVAAEQVAQAGMLLDALKRENTPRELGEKPLALVIEDGAQAGELLRMTIESAGYRVEIARDGLEALDKAKRLRPSVITLGARSLRPLTRRSSLRHWRREQPLSRRRYRPTRATFEP